MSKIEEQKYLNKNVKGQLSLTAWMTLLINKKEKLKSDDILERKIPS